MKFNVQLKTIKLSFFTSNKEKVPFLNKSHIVYEFTCPGCANKYIGKTDTTLFRRTKEHAWTQKDSGFSKHFRCQAYQRIVGMFKINECEIDIKEFQINTVRENSQILHQSDNWLQLCFLESLYIKEYRPSLNDGIKATKALQLH